MKKNKSILLAIYYGLNVLLISWGLLSWLEVIHKNLSQDPEYSALNFFELFF